MQGPGLKAKIATPVPEDGELIDRIERALFARLALSGEHPAKVRETAQYVARLRSLTSSATEQKLERIAAMFGGEIPERLGAIGEIIGETEIHVVGSREAIVEVGRWRAAAIRTGALSSSSAADDGQAKLRERLVDSLVLGTPLDISHEEAADAVDMAIADAGISVAKPSTLSDDQSVDDLVAELADTELGTDVPGVALNPSLDELILHARAYLKGEPYEPVDFSIAPPSSDEARLREAEGALRHARTFIENRTSQLAPEHRAVVEKITRALEALSPSSNPNKGEAK